MFEQSMFLDSAAGKKAGALAASHTLQTLGLGTLLLIPLVYTDRLNFVPQYLPIVPRLTPDPPAPKRRTYPERTEARAAPRSFQAPARIPQLSTLSPIPDDAPPLNFGINGTSTGAPIPKSGAGASSGIGDNVDS